MARRVMAKNSGCRKCPKCDYPLVDLDYMCRKCGATVEPKKAPGIEDIGTPY